MDLDELKAFMAVVETGSYSAAAKSVDFARATLRRQMEELEARSGVSLLQGSDSKLSATAAGELLVERGRAVLAETSALMAALKNFKTEGLTLLLELPVGLPPQLEAAAHRTLRRTAPSLRWQVQYHNGRFNPETQAQWVLHQGPRPAEDGQWRHVTLYRSRRKLVGSRKYLNKHGTPATLEELAKHPLVAFDSAPAAEFTLPTLNQGNAPTIKPVLVSPNLSVVREIAISGQSLALIADVPFARFYGKARTKLATVLEEEVGDNVPVWLSTRNSALEGGMRLLSVTLERLCAAVLGGTGPREPSDDGEN